MYEHPSQSPEHLPAGMTRRWQELCERYFPVAPDGSIWRFSRRAAPRDPEQGWKLHLSATVLTACEVLVQVAPLLRRRGTLFKAPTSLLEVQQINSGLYYGYSQVGKIITVYPESPKAAVGLAQRLYELTGPVQAPTVPFDLKFRPDGCVYYRYGAFRPAEVENQDGTRTRAIRDPRGRLVPDRRDDAAAKPDWVTNPFPVPEPSGAAVPDDSPLKTTYKAFQALTQRGRGGVYKALDLSVAPPRLCILKEGRRGGELSWDGRDGAWRIRNEERVITSLRAAGVDAPRAYASFTVEANHYLVTEFVEGETLQSYLLRRKRRLTVPRSLRLGAELSQLLAGVHAAGWAWRDLKPGNVMLTKTGALRPLDFEGSCPLDRPDAMPWGTPGFAPPARRSADESRGYEDLYALGAFLHLLLTGRLPEPSSPRVTAELRRGVPPEACRLVAELLTANPRLQPPAHEVARRLLAIGANRRRVSTGRKRHAGGCSGSLRRRASSSKRGSERRLSKAGSTVR
jgi:hypothetical protein